MGAMFIAGRLQSEQTKDYIGWYLGKNHGSKEQIVLEHITHFTHAQKNGWYTFALAR
jgi:hypothetical protein